MRPTRESASPPVPLTAQEIGHMLRSRRKHLGLTQAQVVARSTVPSTQYLISLEGGRVNAARSRHLASLTTALDLTPADVALITGVQAAPPVVNIYDAPILMVQSFMLHEMNAPRAGRLSGDPDRIVVLDSRDRTLRPGAQYAVAVKPSLDLYRARCIDQDGTLLLVIGDTAYQVDHEKVLVFGRVTHEVTAL